MHFLGVSRESSEERSSPNAAIEQEISSEPTDPFDLDEFVEDSATSMLSGQATDPSLTSTDIKEMSKCKRLLSILI